MPLYEYHCEANGEHVEVAHRMSERLATWGELCERANRDPGDTPADAPVVKLIGSGSANNIANTLGKKMAAHGERSKNLKYGPMAAPPRNSRW